LLSGIGSVVGADPRNEPAADSLRTGASAGGGNPSFVPNELIVLLDHGPIVPTPEDVVKAVAQHRPVPGDLGIGHPVAARFVISERAGEVARAYLVENPDSPEAILQRYVVLTYPPAVNVDAVAFALEINPNVLWVGKNTLAELSVTEPNDPLFDDNPDGPPRPPEQHQWGSYSLHLHEAWDYTKGHGYVGIVDTGVDADHPDLRAFDASGNFTGGNFRPHLSRDYGYDDDNVDEGQAQGTQTVSRAGHGTHVAGIVGATPNNFLGVAGACWSCSLLISKVSRICSAGDGCTIGANLRITKDDVVDGINGAIGWGAQILNLSLGYRPNERPDCAATPLDPFCEALQLLEYRDAVMAAAAGNDGSSASDWPAVDSRVIGVGGIAPGGAFWNDCPGFECGSNSDPNQLVTPAKQVLSTFYEGLPYSPSSNCSDSVDGTLDGFGPCTGTSMSSPYLAGSAGILRSINPLLTKTNIRSLFTSNLENPPGWNTANGLGKPNVRSAVEAALGRVGGQVLTSRLTPLFSMYSFQAEDHFYTTFPQMGAAAVWSAGGLNGYWRDAGYSSIGPDVVGYGYFPGAGCVVSPCQPEPGASVYVFTTDRLPNGTLLVPLYRLSFNGPNPNNPGNAYNRDTTYTTEAAGIVAFGNVGYKLDGVEGYIYKKCTPEPSCIPAGAVRLFRRYNPQRDDFAIFPESELPAMESQGYTSNGGGAEVIGYAYPNVDSDGDRVINGFESLLGTDPLVADSDCDGLGDGVEILDFPYASKDPRSGPLAILELHNQSISSTQTFEACDTIFAGANLTIEPSASVTLHAGKKVVLRSGFRVKPGAVFRAVVP
jgi:hypothetical protein